MWSISPCLVYGQDAKLTSEIAHSGVKEYENTTKELEREYQKKLKELNDSFRTKSDSAKTLLIANLNKALNEEAAKVNLDEANKIDAVIKRHKAMPLPNLAQIKGELFELTKTDFLNSLEGNWEGQWGTTKNGIGLEIQVNGNKANFLMKHAPNSRPTGWTKTWQPDIDVVHERGTWTLSEYIAHSDQQNYGFVLGDRLILLAWSKFKKQNKNIATYNPDHVGVLMRK